MRMAEQEPERMRQRTGLSDIPSAPSNAGSIGTTSWLRGFMKVRGEMSLLMLGYNLVRVINHTRYEYIEGLLRPTKRSQECPGRRAAGWMSRNRSF